MYYDSVKTGARIQNLREGHYTQDEIAAALHISVDHYRRIETGRRGCSIDLLIELSVIFDVTLDYLVLGRTIRQDSKYIKDELECIMDRLQKLRRSL